MLMMRRTLLRSTRYIEGDDKVIRIHGSKASRAVIAGEQIGKGVRGFLGKWRAGRDKDANTYVIEIAV
jgi:hypothetical protein